MLQRGDACLMNPSLERPLQAPRSQIGSFHLVESRNPCKGDMTGGLVTQEMLAALRP